MATTNRSGLAFVVLAVLALLGPVFWMTMGGGMGPGMMWGSGIASSGGWVWSVGMLLGVLSMLAFWAAIILGIVLLVRASAGPGGSAGPREDSALDILKQRYAAGELTREQYEEMRRALAQ